MKEHYLGHRQRLKERFRKSADTLADYELIELLLFKAIPRKDTKPIAKELIRVFGSFSEVINAPDNRLMEISGIGEAVVTELKLVKAATLRMLRDNVVQKDTIQSRSDLLDYCRAAMAYETREQFRIVFLDKRNNVITDEVQQQGTVDHTPVYIREIAKRALELSSTAIILMHNHPSGNPTPSRADIEMTKQIVIALKNLGIIVHDHIIIGREGHASFRDLGLM